MLSPFLFSLYVAEIVSMLEDADCNGVFVNEDIPNLTSLLFADDLVLCAGSVGRLQKMIDIVDKFCDRWGLSINLSKTSVIVFRNGGPLRNIDKWFLRGKQISIVSFYKYLGVTFSPKLVWTECQKILATQARKGIFLLRRYSYACNGLPVSLQLKLFDKMILPILMYGAEVWGVTKAKHIEQVHIDYCKQILGVPTHTSNAAVYAELGRTPLYIRYFTRCLKYWIKLLNMPDLRYPRAEAEAEVALYRLRM